MPAGRAIQSEDGPRCDGPDSAGNASMPIIYQNSVEAFCRDYASLPYKLAGWQDPYAAPKDLPRRSEFRAWSNSLARVRLMFDSAGLPGDCGVLVEYRLPSTSRRIDLIVTGLSPSGEPGFVIVELKQWSEVLPDPENRPGLVIANTGGHQTGLTEHPCYQAWSYKTYLENMLDAVPEHKLRPKACAYMHNYLYCEGNDPLDQPPNSDLVRETPLFGRLDDAKLGDYLKRHVGRGKGAKIAEQIAKGKLVPSARLADTVSKLFRSAEAKYFVMIDEQKIVYETILDRARKNRHEGRRTVIAVDGGPGTGKSVVAMSVFVQLIREGIAIPKDRNVRFVSPTSSFRTAMLEMLSSGIKDKSCLIKTKKNASQLFCGSKSFYEEVTDRKEKGESVRIYRALIVDEAHRLHSQQNMYRGKNQIEDIVEASDISVFFIDDNQALRPNDIGSVESVKAAAKKFGASFEQIGLTAQFRCAGTEGFLNWVADVLGISSAPSANADGWDENAFDFDILDSARAVLNWVEEKNRAAADNPRIDGRAMISGARLLAGYAWPWTKKGNKNGQVKDVCIDDLKLPWNNRSASYRWAVDPETRHEVGCVHTSQGLEFSYVGIFIGGDLCYDEEKKALRANYDRYFDAGGKMNLKGKSKAEREKDLLKYVCRCYRVLLSRGIFGARVYCEDAALGCYLKARLAEVRSRRAAG